MYSSWMIDGQDKFQDDGLRGKVRRNYIKIAKVGIILGFIL